MSQSENDVRTRFFEKVEGGEKENECWEWTGAISSNGYGSVTIDYERFAAHRVSFWFDSDYENVSDIDTIRHECANKSCVNPNHLLEGTQHANLIDAVKNNNAARQSVTVAEAREIKERYDSEKEDVSQRDLAAEYGTNQKTVWRIVNGESFTFLD